MGISSNVRKRLFVFLSVYFLHADAGFCESQRFTVEGLTSYSIFTGGSNFVFAGESPNYTNKFSVSVDGCKYRIVVQTEQTNIFETTYDGDSLYQLIAMNAGTNFHYTGLVESAEIPDDDGTTANCLWLAYASACYFQGLKTNCLAPIWRLDDPALREDGFVVEGFWSILGAEPHVPNRVVYLSDGVERLAKNLTNRVTFRFAVPFDKGFTNAEYQVLATTNVAGIAVPTAFSFIRYYIHKDKLSVRTLTTGKLLSVSAGTAISSYKPQFQGKAYVIDKRFRDADQPVERVHYYVTDGNWRTEASLSNVYARQIVRDNFGRQARAAAALRSAKRTTMIRVMVLIVIIIPPIILIASRVRRKQPKRPVI